MCAEREMTLKEWVEKLHKKHLAHREYDALIEDINRLPKENEGEGYPKDWVHIDLMISSNGKEVHAMGGSREPGEGDMPFIGFPLLKKYYEDPLREKFSQLIIKWDTWLGAEGVGKVVRALSEELLKKM